ncbi:tetratricopeptide repeat protein [Actinokineospora sp. 24-640]
MQTSDMSGGADDESRRRAFRAWYLRGRAARISGDFPSAFAALREAAVVGASIGVDAASRSLLWIEIGLAFKYSGQPGRAVAWYRRAESAVGSALGQAHPMMADIQHNIGGALHAAGRFDDAEAPAQRAVDLRRRFHGDDRDGVAADEVALAAVLVSLGRAAEAEPLLVGALSHLTGSGQGPREETASALHNLAAIEAGRGRLRQAGELQALCLAIRVAVHGEGSPYTLTALANTARIHLLAGFRAAARQAFKQAAAVVQARACADHPVRQRVAEGLAAVGR